jgi:hypothetical protein
MKQEPIPEEVVRFLEDNIDTVPHLETLLLMRQSGPVEWDAERIAARVYVSTAVAAQILADLARRAILTSVNGEDGVYVYSSEWERTHPVMQTLEHSYRTALVTVAQLIHAKAAGSLRDFARAFRLKSDK